MVNHPDLTSGIILALGTFRLVRLIGWDDLTITLRRRATGLGDRQHHEWAAWIDSQRELGNDPWTPPRGLDPPPVTPRRFWLGKLIRCPWCVGYWISAAVWLAWLAAPAWTTGLAVPWALSAAVGLIAKQLDP